MNELHPDYTASIIVVEDDEGLNRLAQKKLQHIGFATTGVHQGGLVLETVKDEIQKAGHDHDVIMVLDYMLPDMTGEDVIEILNEHDIHIPFIMMSGRGSEKIAVEMMKLGARDYIVKDTAFLDFLPQVVKQLVDTISTERRLVRTESILKEQEENYRMVIENAKDGIYILQDSKFVFVNEAFCRMFEYTMEEIENLDDFMSLVHEDSHDFIKERAEKLNQEDEVNAHYEFSGLTKSGKKLYLDANIGKISFNGRPARQGMIRDVSERKIAEEHQHELEKMKSDFMLLVSHELGTPLMVVDLSIEYLVDCREEIDEEEFHSIVNKINLNMDRIKKLKQFMSNMLILEQGKFKPQLKPIFLHHIAKQTLDELSLLADKKEIEMVFNIPDLNMVMADKERVHEVFSTLIDNAIRYTPQGGRVELLGQDFEDKVNISVIDNGIGIEKDQHDRIFERFYQIQDILTHKDGFGLGLSIAKGIIESHGGTIEVASEPRKGSIFTFTLMKDPSRDDR